MNNIFIVSVNKTLLNYCLTIPVKLYGKHDIRNSKNEICGYKAYQLHFNNDLLYKIKETFI